MLTPTPTTVAAMELQHRLFIALIVLAMSRAAALTAVVVLSR